ncbi:MAG: putative glycoside hydrolase [Bacteroidota bacterium]
MKRSNPIPDSKEDCLKDRRFELWLRGMFAAFLLLGFCDAAVLAQSADWPPEPLQPASIMQSISLAEGRFVPSTSRWNLVWADQIIPYQHSTPQLEFAARHYIGSQKLWADQAALFRAIQPNFLMLAYHLAAGLNPGKNSDCPDPKSMGGDGFIGVVSPAGYVSECSTHFLPWLMARGIDSGSARYEEMFQHYDSVSPATRVWHQDPYWLMNLDNPDWREYIGDACIEWMEGNENEGCFFDVAVETSSALYNPKQQNPSPGNFDWWAPPHRPVQSAAAIPDRRAFGDWMNLQYREYFLELYARFHGGTPHFLVLPNVDQLVTTVYDPVWLDDDVRGKTVDGVMMEGFGYYNGYDMWLTLERCVRHITGKGKILIAQFSTNSDADRLRRTAMYMLVKNDNSFINAVSSKVTWYPEYELDLGEMSPVPSDLEQLRVSGSGSDGLWLREFEKGIVLVNTAASDAVYELPDYAQWRRYEPAGGGAVATNGTPVEQRQQWSAPLMRVDIPASGGVILRKEVAAHTEQPGTGPAQPRILNCYPFPVSGDRAVLLVDVPAGMEGVWMLELRDILGRSVQRQELNITRSGKQSVSFASSGPAAGCYLLRLSNIRGAQSAMRILVR